MPPFPVLSWSCQYRQLQICSFKISVGHALSPYSPQEGNSYFHSYSQESISKSEYLCVGVIGKIQTDIPDKCVTSNIQSLSEKKKKKRYWQVFKVIFQNIRCWLNIACYHDILYLIKARPMHFLTDVETVSKTVLCVTTYCIAGGLLRLISSETHTSALYTLVLIVLLTAMISFPLSVSWCSQYTLIFSLKSINPFNGHISVCFVLQEEVKSQISAEISVCMIQIWTR